MADEQIPGIQIPITADFSDLDAAFDAAVARALADSQNMASAIASAMSTTPDISGITGAVDQVDAAWKQLGQDVSKSTDVSLTAPDTSAVTESLAAIATAVQATADSISTGLSGAQINIDTSGAISSFDSLASAAQTTAGLIQQDFAVATLPPLDTTAITDSLTAIDAVAQSSLAQMEQYFADAPLPPINTAPIEESLRNLSTAASALAGPLGEVADDIGKDNAAALGAEAALADLVQKFKDGEISSGEYISQANALAAALEALGQKAPEVGSGFDSANESLKQFSLGAQDLITKEQEADAALQQAKTVLLEIQAAYAQGAVDADVLARAEQNVASAFEAANPAIQQTKAAVEETKDSMAAMNQVLGVLGVTLSLGAFVHFAESIGEAYDSITRTNIALTTLTGSASQAAEMVEKLDKLGVADGLSMPSLEKASIRMQEFLPEGSDIVGILGQIADAASLTGTSIETASQKFANIVETGKLSVKALKDLGLSFDDIKKAMEDAGVSADKMGANVKKGFEQLSQNDQLVVLQTALEKFKGTAEDIAENTFQGQWHRAVAQFESDINTIIKDMGDLNGKIPDLTKSVNSIAVVFVAIGGTVKTVVDDITSNVVALGVQLQGIGKAAKDALSGNFQQAAKDISDAMEAARAVSAKAAADWKTNVDTMNKTISDLENQVKTSVPVVIGHLNNLGKEGQDTAAKLAAAAAAVGKFEDQIAAGGSITQLQKDFENASAAISKLATADLPAAIKAVDDYTQAQIRNGANASVMMEALTKYQGLLDKLAKEDLPAAVAGEQKLVDELTSAKEPLGLVTEAFEKEEAMIQKLAKEDYPAAIAAQEKLVTSLQGMPQYANLMNTAIDTLNKMLTDHETKLNAAVAAQEKFVKSITNVALGIPGPQKALDDMNRTLDLIGGTAADMPAKMTPLNRALVDAGLGAEAANTSLKKIPGALDSIHTPIASVITDLDNLAKDAQNTGQWDNYEAAIDKVGKRFATMSKTDLPDAVTEFESIIQEMLKVGAPVDIITAALDKLAPVLKRMSDENLPGAKAAWQGYMDLLKQVPSAIKDIEQADQEQIQKEQATLDLMKKRGDAYGYILDQQGKLLALEINYATKTQQDSNDIVLALEAQKLARKALADESHGYADIEVKAINDVLGAFDRMGQAMGDAIVNGKNMGEALIGEFKKLGASIIGDVINAALLPMKIELEKLISESLPGLNLGLKQAAGATTALGAASTQTAAATDTMSVSAVGATGSVTALGIASTLAAIQMNTLITAIAAVVGAIAAIVGDVYLAAIDSKLFITNTTLAGIKNETQTRRSDAWTQHNQLYARLGEVWNTLQAINDAIGQGKAGGGDSSGTQGDLQILIAETQAMHQDVRAINFSIQALNQTSTGYLQSIISELMDVNSELFKINYSIQSLGSGTGGAQASQGQSQSQEQSNAIVGAMKANADTITSSLHSEFGALLPPVGTIGRVLDAAAQEELRKAQRDYENAMNVQDALDALGREYDADSRLMQDALNNGNLEQAAQYQQAAQAVEREIASTQEGAQYAQKTSQAIQDYTQESKSAWEAAEAALASAQQKVDADIEALTEATAGGNAKIIAAAQAQLDKDNEALKQAQANAQAAAAALTYGDAQIVDASKQTGASVVSQVAASGGAVVNAVNNSAAAIGAAVSGAMAGAFALGGGINGPVSASKSGAGTGGSGPGVIASAGNQSPVVQDVTLPGGGTGAYTTPLSGSGSTTSTGSGNPHSVPLGEYPTPHPVWDPKTNTFVYQYQTGGMVNTDGLLAAEKGEAVLTPDQVKMLQSLPGDIAGIGTSQIGPIADLAQQITQAQEKVHMDLDTLNQAFASGNKAAIDLAEKLLEIDKQALIQAEQAAAQQEIADKASQEGQQQLTQQVASIGGPIAKALTDTLGEVFSGGPVAKAMTDTLDTIANSVSPGAGAGEYFSTGGTSEGPGPSAGNPPSPSVTDYYGYGGVGPGPGPSAGNTLSPGAAPGEYHDAGNPVTPPHDVFSGYNPYGANQPFLVPRYQTGGMVSTDGLLAAEKGEGVLTPEQTQALKAIPGTGHVIPQGGQPERVAYGTPGPMASEIGPVVDAIAEATKKAQDAAKTQQERLDLLNQQLAASIANSGPVSVQTIELQNQIKALLDQIANSTDKTASNTGTMASNPPGTGPSTIDNSISPSATDYFGYGGQGSGPGPSAGNPPSPSATDYFGYGGQGQGPGPSAGNPLSPGADRYFDAGMQGPGPRAMGPPTNYNSPPPPTPHALFSGYNPYGAIQPFLAGSFAEGGRVPETGPYLVHKDEEVIPSEISQALRRMLTVPMSPQLSYQAPGGGGAHGPITVNAPITITAGAQDGEQIARKLVAHLKRVIPQGGLTS